MDFESGLHLINSIRPLRAMAVSLLLFAITICPASTVGQEQWRPDSAYPAAESKKGLQVELLDDALQLGVKHAALNVNLSELVAPTASTSGTDHLAWTNGQRTFHFRREPVERLDHTIQALSSHGVIVHLIILVYESNDAEVNRVMLHPNYDRAAPNHLSAFNSRTAEGRAWLQATLEFLAQRWSASDEQQGRVAGFILGNEVNSHWFWSNMGRASMTEFAGDYASALEIVHHAVRRHSSWARIYISLDHHWNIRYPAGDDRQAFAGKELISTLR